MGKLVTSQHGLLGLLLAALTLIPLTEAEHRIIIQSFRISYETHRHAPHRKTGEIYFLHIFRQVLRAIHMMRDHEVVSAELICIIMLHDAVEDADKGKRTPFIVTSEIQLLVGDFITYCVLALTKKKDIESREDYLKRLSHCEAVLVLIAKPFDGEDNIKTLAATDPKTQAMKVREIFVHYPAIKAHAIRLITFAGKKGDLPDWKNWIKLIRHIHQDLRHHAWRQRRRLRRRGIEVM